VEVAVWMMLGPITAALVTKVRFTVVTTVIYIAAVILAAYLEPFSQSIAPALDLNTRMQIAAGNLIMMGLVATASALYLMFQVERYRRRADDLLLNILPGTIAARLKENPETIADGYSEVSVLFADIVDFTTLSSSADPVEIVNLLNEIFSSFDDLAAKHGLEKIKTIGDAYMVAAGIPVPREDHARVLARFALAARDELAEHNLTADVPVELRIGINSGPVVAGVIGRRRFLYDLWGDTVNTASRMESHGLPGQVQITEATRALLDGEFTCTERGVIDVKGKGPTRTWLLGGEAVAVPA
jgi:adenylate cyclase